LPADVSVAWQPKALGTGDAVRWGLAELDEAVDQVLVVYADTALVRAETLERLLSGLREAPAAVLTANVSLPSGYGRVIRASGGTIARLIEERDLTEAQSHTS